MLIESVAIHSVLMQRVGDPHFIDHDGEGGSYGQEFSDGVSHNSQIYRQKRCCTYSRKQ